MTPTNWFRDLLGFDEQSYAATKQQLVVRGGRLIASATGASYDVGTLEIPSLGEFRTRVAGAGSERDAAIRVSTVVADVENSIAAPRTGTRCFKWPVSSTCSR